MFFFLYKWDLIQLIKMFFSEKNELILFSKKLVQQYKMINDENQ